MATQDQAKYINDLVVVKTKEFKEVKELLIAKEIVAKDAQTILEAQSIAEITHALDDLQASKLIDALIAAKTPQRSRAYSQKRIEATVTILDDIISTVEGWTF